MKEKRLFICIISIVLCFGLTACAASLEKRKKQSRATRNLGEAYMRQGNYTEGLKELLKAEKIYADDHLLHNDLGLVYLAKKRYDKAEQHFKKAIKLKPEYASARNNLGLVYLAAENWDAAIKSFESVTSDLLYGTPHFPLSNLGLAYYHKKDYQNAEKYYLKALDIEPNFILALRGLGKTYLAVNKNPAAISVFEKAVKRAPNYADIYLDLGNAYRSAGEYQKALFAYQKAQDLAPGSDVAEAAKQEEAKITGQ